MTDITSFNGLINTMIAATEHQLGTNIDELLLQVFNTTLDNERMDYQEELRKRDEEIERLKVLLLADKASPSDSHIQIAQSTIPTGATADGLAPHMAAFEPGTLIVLASDQEGNVIAPMDTYLTASYYVPNTAYDGQLVDNDNPDENPHAIPCVVFWPK